MNAKLAGFIAAPLLALSSYGFAQDVVPSQEAASEPMMLSMTEMDGVTAGHGGFFNFGNIALVGQSVWIDGNNNYVRQTATVVQVIRY